MASPRFGPFTWGRIKDEVDDGEATPKRISTPAGLRLSSIINSEKHPGAGNESPTTPSFASRFGSTTLPSRKLSFNAGKRGSGGIRVVNEEVMPMGRSPGAISRFKEELQSLKSLKGAGPPSPLTPSPGYQLSRTSSGKSVRLLAVGVEEKDVAAKQNSNKRSRRRIIIGLIVFFLVLIAVIIGLVVGLSKKHKSSEPSRSTSPASQSGTASASTTGSAPTIKPMAPVPSSFPAGTYSFNTFLDMPITDCVSNPAAWTCPPNTYGPENPKSLATFPFTITGSSGSYNLESTSNTSPFANISTASTTLTLIDRGNSTENYRFRIFVDKIVSTTINGVAATCTFKGTTVQGNIYTKMSSTYPLAGQTVSNSAGQAWPYAVKIEQSTGEDGLPNCVNSRTGTAITGLTAQSSDSLCSCIYRNFKTGFS